MLIKFADKNTIDVFVGAGWKQWTRFEVKGKYFKKVAGVSLSPANMSMLKERFNG